MYAAYYDKTGSARDVLNSGDLPKPVPQAGELLVRVHASGINPSDTKKRAALMKTMSAYDRVIPHSDGAGIVEAVGAGVEKKRIGERVWLWNAQWQRAFGTAAQWTAVPDAQAVTLPDHLSFGEGACLGIPAQTAWVATHSHTMTTAGTVLVHGGAGAVGELSIVMAAQSGARVIATVSTPEKAAIAKAAGAEIVYYKQPDVIARILELNDGQGVDHIVDVDFGANWRVNAAVLKTNGSICAYSAPSTPVFEFEYYAFGALAAQLRFVQVYLLPQHERQAAIKGISNLLVKKLLPIRIARVFSLDEIIEAHELQESGSVIGNIVLNID